MVNNWSLTLAFHIIFTHAPVNFMWAQAHVCLGVATPLHNFTTLIKCPVITSVQELIKNCFAELQKLHSRSPCHILPCEDIIGDAYIQELNAIVLYAVLFVLSRFHSSLLQCLSGILQETDT